MIALIDLAVHDEIIHLGVFQRSFIIGGHQHAHVGEDVALLTLLADVGADDLLVHIVVGPVLGVVAPGHDIGQGLGDGGHILYTGSVRSHLVSLFSGAGPLMCTHMRISPKSANNVTKYIIVKKPLKFNYESGFFTSFDDIV